MFTVIKKSQCFAVSGISEVCSIFKKKSHDALLLVGFQKCVQCLKNNSRCFTVSGISEVCSMLKKSNDALL